MAASFELLFSSGSVLSASMNSSRAELRFSMAPAHSGRSTPLSAKIPPEILEVVPFPLHVLLVSPLHSPRYDETSGQLSFPTGKEMTSFFLLSVSFCGEQFPLSSLWNLLARKPPSLVQSLREPVKILSFFPFRSYARTPRLPAFSLMISVS